MKFATQAIHVGQEADEQYGAIIPPIYQTSTYKQQAPGVYKGYDYTRAGNPNFSNLEATLATLEQGKYATVFSSGLAAITALASMLKSGDKVLATNDLYGGTWRLFDKIFKKFGVDFELMDTQDLGRSEQILSLRRPAMLWLESPTNPLLKISDIKSLADLCQQNKALLVVDNTFASPYFQNPLNLGANVVVHSTTKYIGGHSDIIGGAVITNEQSIKQQLDFARMAIGLNPSPFDVWLTSRGLKTLAARMEKHQENARLVADFFNHHWRAGKVYYPGLESHTNHLIAKKQMRGYGGIVTVELKASLEETKKLVSSFKVFTLAESLGGVESLVDHPASMTHASLPPEAREKIGISDGLVRFSVGIEDSVDLIEDLKQVLDK